MHSEQTRKRHGLQTNKNIKRQKQKKETSTDKK